jgi:molecular chaperone DnaK
VREAREHEGEDQRLRTLIEARNQADTLIYSIEKSIADLGDKVPANDRENINEKISQLREAMPGEDLERIKSLSEELQQMSYALSQQAYQTQGGPGENGQGAGPEGPEPEGGDDVIEGEFEQI